VAGTCSGNTDVNINDGVYDAMKSAEVRGIELQVLVVISEIT
jgi:hypothetical protein